MHMALSQARLEFAHSVLVLHIVLSAQLIRCTPTVTMHDVQQRTRPCQTVDTCREAEDVQLC